MKTLTISIITILIFSGCVSARVNAHGDGKHNSVGAKTNVLKF
ncbi:hypothetical protein [Sulfurimonas sp.]